MPAIKYKKKTYAGATFPVLEMTKAEYDALSDAKKMDGTVYMITDDDGGWEAERSTYDNTTSGLTATNVQDALDELNSNTLDDDWFTYNTPSTLAFKWKTMARVHAYIFLLTGRVDGTFTDNQVFVTVNSNKLRIIQSGRYPILHMDSQKICGHLEINHSSNSVNPNRICFRTAGYTPVNEAKTFTVMFYARPV